MKAYLHGGLRDGETVDVAVDKNTVPLIIRFIRHIEYAIRLREIDDPVVKTPHAIDIYELDARHYRYGEITSADYRYTKTEVD